MIRFAPLNVPLRRRLQTAAVLQWIFSFLALAQCCLASFILLSLSAWWLAALLYAGWLWLDWDTPDRGGRRCQWVRRWSVWERFRDYFPIKLVKTVELDPNKNYVFGFHPHGVLATGAFCNFCTEATGFSALFPGLKSHLLMLPFWFRVPFFRDYIMCGAPEKEGLHQTGNETRVCDWVKRRAQLVPVFSFGENELFDQVRNPAGSPLRTLQNRLQSIMGISLPLINGRGIFQYSFGLLPHRKAILTVVGKPIQVARSQSPGVQDIDALHKVYLEHLSELFERHKHEYGLQEHQHLTFT